MLSGPNKWYRRVCRCNTIRSAHDKRKTIWYAEIAPPPFAWPSIFVMIIEPKLLDSLKALLCASAACPILASRIIIVESGLIALPISTISLNNSTSCRWRPEVSTMMTVYFSFLNLSTPWAAITAGSVSVYEPKKGIRALMAFCFNWSNAPARNVSAQTRHALNPRRW